MRSQFELSGIDRFGYRMARLKIGADDSAVNAAGIIELCRAKRIEMLILRVPIDRLQLVQNLESQEFRLMDCLVYYEAPTVDVLRTEPRGFELREVNAADTEQVCDVARGPLHWLVQRFHGTTRITPAG